MAHGATHRVIISVGANIRPAENIAAAKEILQAETKFIGDSAIIETAPVGYENQPNFLNGAFVVETALDRELFNRYLKEVEARLGRVKGPIKSGPRIIDLDLIVWDDRVVHEDFYSKDYVIIPVAEVIAKFDIDISSDVPGTGRAAGNDISG